MQQCFIRFSQCANEVLAQTVVIPKVLLFELFVEILSQHRGAIAYVVLPSVKFSEHFDTIVNDVLLHIKRLFSNLDKIWPQFMDPLQFLLVVRLSVMFCKCMRIFSFGGCYRRKDPTGIYSKWSAPHDV